MSEVDEMLYKEYRKEIAEKWSQILKLFNEIAEIIYETHYKVKINKQWQDAACSILCDYDKLSYGFTSPSGSKWLETFLALVILRYDVRRATTTRLRSY
jgi:hypothetical protein